MSTKKSERARKTRMGKNLQIQARMSEQIMEPKHKIIKDKQEHGITNQNKQE